jgi:Spy/CpxP family protein refolding chaperone
VAEKARITATYKVMKAYKLIAAIALGGLMACGPIARAEDSTNTPPPPSGGEKAPPPRGQRGGRPNFQAIIEKLDLTDDQKPKVKAVMDDQREKMMALRDDTALSPEDRQTKRKAITEAGDAKLKEILTPEQYTKFLDLRKQMMNRRGGGPGGGAGGNPPPPANNQ